MGPELLGLPNGGALDVLKGSTEKERKNSVFSNILKLCIEMVSRITENVKFPKMNHVNCKKLEMAECAFTRLEDFLPFTI